MPCEATHRAVERFAGNELLGPQVLFRPVTAEGFDERIRVGLKPREISIGDYVLSGGEPAAMVLIDAIVRLLPGALGDPASAADDSFSYESGLLEYPQYTRPREFRGMGVPEILLSGDHAKMEAWRREQARLRTRRRRPDLLEMDQTTEATGKSPVGDGLPEK